MKEKEFKEEMIEEVSSNKYRRTTPKDKERNRCK